jgi:hypothetical protein
MCAPGIEDLMDGAQNIIAYDELEASVETTSAAEPVDSISGISRN